MQELTFEQIKSITFGALKITEQQDGIHFFKCTDKQNEAWGKQSEILYTRALTTTGVRLEFYTDSEHFEFMADCGRFDIWVDGVIKYQTNMSVCNEKGTPFSIELGGGEKRIMLAFPSHSIGVLKYVKLDDGANIRAREFSGKMLFIGDSITQGFNSSFDSISYAYRTAMYYDSDFVIQGIGGAYFEESSYDHIPYDPDTVIVAYGTNDFNKRACSDQLDHHARGFLSKLKAQYADKRLIAITPIWRGDHDKPRQIGTFEQVIDIVRCAALDNGFEVVDGMTLTPHMSVFFKDEYLHPNDVGFGIYAENLIKYINS